ncbi:unnamed protein product [Trichogramma brassicae]|uniref:EF-hand domain-containing protein n=1 Tax=Trichogramma brassicae TaxID=86971 RepID=A0A6H5IGZ9_9HYME|nr:unnamed protein product [Trichogramma brassicae]
MDKVGDNLKFLYLKHIFIYFFSLITSDFDCSEPRNAENSSGTENSEHTSNIDYLYDFYECPEGVVHEDSFKDIYAKYFPHGNSSIYAHYVFKAFDVNCSGAISFRDLLVTLSTLLRGSIYEKLRWTFKLYDINGDGCISKGELGEIISSVHELMGRKHRETEERQAREQLEKVFRKLDLNQDGVITIEEFMESCLKVCKMIRNN